MKKKSKSAPVAQRKKIRRTEILSGGASTLLRDDTEPFLYGEDQGATQRDLEPDEFDIGTDVQGDRIRGAGGQSLAELMIAKEQDWGLDEHGGGLRFDKPEPNVNDYDPDEPTEMQDEVDGKSRSA